MWFATQSDDDLVSYDILRGMQAEHSWHGFSIQRPFGMQR